MLEIEAIVSIIKIFALSQILEEHSKTKLSNTPRNPYIPHLLPLKCNFRNSSQDQQYLLDINDFFLYCLGAIVVPHVT